MLIGLGLGLFVGAVGGFWLGRRQGLKASADTVAAWQAKK